MNSFDERTLQKPVKMEALHQNDSYKAVTKGDTNDIQDTLWKLLVDIRATDATYMGYRFV